MAVDVSPFDPPRLNWSTDMIRERRTGPDPGNWSDLNAKNRARPRARISRAALMASESKYPLSSYKFGLMKSNAAIP